MKFFSLLKDQNLHLAPKTRVIPAHEFSQLVEASEILEAAKNQSVTIREEVEKECEQRLLEAEKRGFDEGLAKWNEQLALLEKEIDDVRKEMEKAVVPLALTAVKKIIGHELETKPKTISDIVITAAGAVAQHHKVTIYVHKNDLEQVEKTRGEIKKVFEHLDSLSITSRDDVEPGGCVIVTERGIINAQLDSQLRALEAAFTAFLKKKKGEEAS